ncbi:MAG: response regulator transcription factor [Lachnospiraceae bacterium]|nr:response regulator transcription factor [Lachnospiraceae bacterium]
MFRLAVCDDDPQSLSHMISLIEEYRLISPFPLEYAAFHNGMELASALEQGTSFDLYCLDIVMPGFDGIELGREIRNHDKAAPIIYFTSSPEFALDSYSVKAANYILKPITKEKFFFTLNEVLEEIKHTEEASLTLKDSRGIHKILLSSLVYAEAMGRKVLYHLNSGRVLECSIRFSEVSDTLLKYPYFAKPHRSYIVNMNYINTIENTAITLQTSDSIPIAQGKGKEIKDVYLAFQMKRE